MAGSRSFVANVFTVAGGTALAQAVSLAALPFITRFYPPDVYGLFVVFLAYGGIVVPIACARFDVAIALPNSRRGASAVALGGLGIAAATAALTGLVVAVLEVVAPDLTGTGAWLLPLYVLLGGALLVFGSWSARVHDYRRLSLSRIFQATVTALLSIGLVFAFGPLAMMLIVATVVGQVAALVVLLAGLARSGFEFDVRPHQVLRWLRHFRRLTWFNVPHVLSDAAQASGLPLLVAFFFGAPAAAFYSFSTRLLKAPLGLISGAISQVYYPRAAANRNDNEKLRHEASRILAALALTALLMLTPLLLIPDAAFAYAFGPKWADVGAYVRALSPWILSSFVAAPLSVLYLVKEEFALDFYLGAAGSVLAFGTLLAAHGLAQGVMVSMWALTTVMTVYVVASTVAEFSIVIGRDRRRG